MLRNLIRSFQKTLVLNNNIVNKNLLSLAAYQQQRHIYGEQPFAGTASKPKVDTPLFGTADVSNSDYIVPIRNEYDKKAAANLVVATLRTRFRLNDEDVEHIMKDEVIKRSYRGKSLVRTLELLCLEGVSKKSFIDYPWLVTLDRIRLEQKLLLIKSMPVRDINHFVAFLRLSVTRLKKLVASLNRESDSVPFGNRIYHISDQLKVHPYTVSKYLSKRLFILEMPFEMLEQNLQNMIQYNVSPLNILRDLWAFRYTPKSVKLRLERAKRAKKDKIMPWMVRCPEPILQKSLKLSLDELEVLGNKSSAVEYIAERLDFSVPEAKAIMDRHPQVHTVRVTKIKEVLDYLLDEAGYNRFDIAQTPRILCHSLKTTKKRLEELKSIGCRPSTLVILCRSKREYIKFLNMWTDMKTKRGQTSSPAKEDQELSQESIVKD